MREIENNFPLSPMQQGMLFQELADKGSGVNIEQIVCSLREPVSVAAMETAWSQVVNRHESLRSYFQPEGLDEPRQHVLPTVNVPLEVHDISGKTSEAQAETFAKYLEDDRLTGFSLEQAPLLRLAIFCFGDTDFRLVWSFHHIIVDGRSQSVVLREVFSLYDALCDGQRPELEDPPQQRDFIDWLNCEDRSGREVFWREYLQGITAPTPLVVDKRQSTGGEDKRARGERQIELSSELLSSLLKLANENDVTLNTLVQGAWSLLLHRYSGEENIVFGAARAVRSWSPSAKRMVGLCMNTVPLRIAVSPDMSLLPWLQELRDQQSLVRDFENTSLVRIKGWSDIPANSPLFESLVVFDRGSLNSALQADGGAAPNRDFQLIEDTGFPLTLYAFEKPIFLLKLAYDRARFDDDAIIKMLGHLTSLLESLVRTPFGRLGDLALLTATEQHQLLAQWNQTESDLPAESCIHELIEAQARETPQAVALVFGNVELTYAELNAKANQLAHYVRKLGVQPDVLVGIYMDRSLDMMVGLLAILKAGGAYLPLDPTYPSKRIAFMVEDAKIGVLVTQSSLVEKLPPHNARVVCVDGDWSLISSESVEDVESGVTGENLSYVIYTSGSTGKPKGVMVRHRNVINFFVGMDVHLNPDPPGVWLAVTSLSFDISVLELLWTLARGFQVVLYTGTDQEIAPVATSRTSQKQASGQQQIEMSLFYFASDEGENVQDKYRLLIEGAKFADENGFVAVWTPERHFHAFGGLYPNPSVAGAAIAVLTKRVQIRAGSCVLPLHNPIRVAEEWSLVDNLSKGRVGISVASGWHPNDFVIAPQNYEERNEIMARGIDTVRRLWRGETVSLPGPKGDEVQVSILPRPIQPELPLWVTAAGNPETFRKAGENGANMLTHLLGQSIDELAEKLEIYRQARRASNHGPGEGHVTLMLHTFVADSESFVRSQVHQPLKDYLRSAAGLIKKYAYSFPAFKTSGNGAGDVDTAFEQLSDQDMEALLEHSFNRYYETSGLFGTPEQCVEMVNKLKQIGIDEIACLIDFGVPSEIVLQHLPHLNRLRELTSRSGKATHDRDGSIPALIDRHGVTHFQCTPSMATMLAIDEHARESLQSLSKMMVGGEAFPPQLAADLRSLVDGDVINMYGPTETTIWSTTQTVEGVNGSVPIGRPIANTQLYVLNKDFQPVPVGVPGELFIAGEGVVRGYHDRPQLTKERFIDNPFVDTPHANMYRTGDLVRYRADGVLEFLGRIDHQVKIRGHRIELGEIEAVLSRHAKAKEVVVVAQQDPAGNDRLVAYCVPKQQEKLSAEEIREFLQDQLPAQMVPSAFVILDALPLTPNGKVDRKALPKPDQVGRSLGAKLVAPRTQIEKDLMSIWRDTLGVKEISIQDSFFDVGGDSLSAVRVAYLTSKHFKVDFPLQMLLQATTVEQLAKALKEQGLSRDLASVVPLQTGGSKPPFFFLTGRIHFGDRLGPDQPVYRVIYQDLDRERPFVRIEDMATHSINSVRKMQPAGPYYLGGHDHGGMVAFEMAQQLQRQGEQVALLVLCECWAGGSEPPQPGTTSAYRLWQRANYHIRKARRAGPVKEMAGIFRSLKTKTERAAWRKQMGRRTRSRQGHRAAAFESLEQYTPQIYDGCITVIRSAERSPWIDDDPLNGWRDFATGGVESYEVPGTHSGIYREPHVATLANTLNDILHKAKTRVESQRTGELGEQNVSVESKTREIVSTS